MLILHAGLTGDDLLLWGEATADPTGAPRRRGRRSAGSATPAGPPLPIGATEAALRDGLAAAGLAEAGAAARATSALAWLPTLAGLPVASSPLIAEPPGGDGPPTLAPWTITGLSLTGTALLDLLVTCHERPLLAPGVVAGADLTGWAAALRLAGALVARQQVLPDVVDRAGEYRATWTPLLAGTDADRLARLAAALPPVARALTSDASGPPTAPAATVLGRFLALAVDALIRATAAPASAPLASGPAGSAARARRPAFASPHDQWLHALRAPDGRLTGAPDELAAFAAQVHAWQRPVVAAATAPYRLCLRLEEPATAADDALVDDLDLARGASPSADALTPGRLTAAASSTAGPPMSPNTDGWYVRYLLQAANDPSLLLPAADVWSARGPAAARFRRGEVTGREVLLAALGQAAGLVPEIAASLRAATPVGYPLDSAGAYRFLTDQAALLEAAGVGVLLPAWWTGRGPRRRLTARASVRSAPAATTGRLTLDRLVAVDWTVALGDATLSLADLEALAALKAPLVRLRGQWVELRPEDLAAALAALRRGPTQVTAGEAVRLALGAGAAVGLEGPGGLGDLALDEVTADGWFGALLTRLEGEAATEELAPAADFRGTLRPYQRRGLAWLSFLAEWGLGGCLADDMGLGKCVIDETLLCLNGALKRADAIWETHGGGPWFDGEGWWAEPTAPLSVDAIDEASGRMVRAQVARLYRQRVTERLRCVTLDDGSSITITGRHKLLSERGWTTDLRPGGYVCVPGRLIWEGQPLDPDLVTVLAWQIAEGAEHPRRPFVSITQKDERVLSEVRSALIQLGERHAIKLNGLAIRREGHRSRLLVHSAGYRRFLTGLGYDWGHRSKDKCFPGFLMQADQRSIAVFLRHFFDAEGSVSHAMRSVEISTASPLLAQQLSVLLRRFGIWLRLVKQRKCATNGARIFRDYYRGTIGGTGLRLFRDRIGFGDAAKADRLNTICSYPANTNIEGIPASWLVAGIVADTGLPLRHFGMHNTVYVTGTQQFSRQSLGRVSTAIGDILDGTAEAVYRQLPPSRWTNRTLAAYSRLDHAALAEVREQIDGLGEREVFYCRIRSVEDIDYDGWVYDFEIEERHNYVANQILCHNTVTTLALLQRRWLVGAAGDGASNGTTVEGAAGAPARAATDQAADGAAHGAAGQAAGSNGARRPTLLVGPTSLVGNWQREAARFTPDLPVLAHHGPDRARGDLFVTLARRQALVITSYALLQRDLALFQAVEWAGVILDEAQNIKNSATQQARAARALAAGFRLALTGTPVENSVADLWSLMAFLNPGLLGGQAAFRRAFVLPIQAGRDPEAADRLKRLTGPFILRRLKSDKTIIADLPDKQEMTVACTLTPEQATLYRAVLRELEAPLDAAEGIERRGLILATLAKLKQVCNHPAQFLGDGSPLPGRSGKLARLSEMLEEVLAVGERALVFTQFAAMGTLLQRHLQETFGREVLFLHGGVPKAKRDHLVERFQASVGPPIFILSLKAGGTGLTLTRANHVFHYDRWWNPAVENQATDRAYRIGQTKSVQVHRFVCAGTLEERIAELIEQKRALAERVVGTGEAWLTELSTAELRELVALRDEAVGGE